MENASMSMAHNAHRRPKITRRAAFDTLRNLGTLAIAALLPGRANAQSAVNVPLANVDLQFKISRSSVALANPDEVVIKDPLLRNDLARYSDETRAQLNTLLSEYTKKPDTDPIKPSDISIDQHGQVVIANKEFSASLSAWHDLNAATEDTNYCCACNGYKCK
jgi:hypothetical protein